MKKLAKNWNQLLVPENIAVTEQIYCQVLTSGSPASHWTVISRGTFIHIETHFWLHEQGWRYKIQEKLV